MDCRCAGGSQKQCGVNRGTALRRRVLAGREGREDVEEHIGVRGGQAGHWRRIPHRQDRQEVNCVPSRKELLMSAVPVVRSPCVGAGD